MKYQKPGIAFIFLLVLIVALAAVDHFTNSDGDMNTEEFVVVSETNNVELFSMVY